MVSCYQNATGIELLDDYCFVIHNQASPDEIFSSSIYFFILDMIVLYVGFHMGPTVLLTIHSIIQSYIFYSTFV